MHEHKSRPLNRRNMPLASQFFREIVLIHKKSVKKIANRMCCSPASQGQGATDPPSLPAAPIS